ETIPLSGNENFGYNVNGTVFYGSAGKLITRDTPKDQVRNYYTPQVDGYVDGVDDFEEGFAYPLPADAVADEVWKTKYGEEISFAVDPGSLVEAEKEGRLGAFRIKEGIGPEAAKARVIAFILSIQKRVTALERAAKEYADGGDYEQAVKAFEEVQRIDPFGALSAFTPAQVRVEGGRILTGLDLDDDFMDPSLGNDKRVASLEQSLQRFAEGKNIDMRTHVIMTQGMFNRLYFKNLIENITGLFKPGHLKKSLQNIFKGVLILSFQTISPVMSWDVDKDGYVNELYLYRPSKFNVTILDMMLLVALLSNSWLNVVFIGSFTVFIRVFVHKFYPAGHELSHFYQRLVMNRMHRLGLVSAENKVPYSSLERPLKFVRNPPTRPQFDRVTREIISDVFKFENIVTDNTSALGRIFGPVLKALQRFNPLRFLSGSKTADDVSRPLEGYRDVKESLPALADRTLYLVSADPERAAAFNWMKEACAAGVNGAGITLMKEGLEKARLKTLGKVLVSLPGEFEPEQVMVWAGASRSEEGGQAALLYLEPLDHPEIADQPLEQAVFLGRGARSAVRELNRNPEFRKRLLALYKSERILGDLDPARADFKPGVVVMDGPAALFAAQEEGEEDPLLFNDSVFAYADGPEAREALPLLERQSREAEASLRGEWEMAAPQAALADIV
ncbi:MAG: hypothetical protein ACYC5N_11220, partial [Endomicrobiales bacterium]